MDLGPGVTVEDYEKAAGTLRLNASACGPVGQAWIERAVAHLNTRLDDYLRETPAIRTEQQALALIRTIGGQLEAASEALKVAAERLKHKGDANGANLTFRAHITAREQSRALIGT